MSKKQEFINFIENVSSENDIYKEERNKIKDICHAYQDGNNCKRIIEFLEL